AAECSKGLASVGLENRVPVIFGVLTCDTLDQALMRAGSKAGNKGSDCAVTAIEMANILKTIRRQNNNPEEKNYNA
ncbi:MAG: 6,7-dimethyl-8-ribityllumazine synthase, partial [Synergistaceae bacterium]|nr:6,7-dimethyl-8-ribityllumazine synthase [Synergistaceae bacterium]